MYASQFQNPASLYSMYFIRSNLFIANCYGSKAHVFMSEVHFNIWKAKTGQTKEKSFKMVSLPPTFEEFLLHLLLAQFHICIWKPALNPYPPTLDPSDYGWNPLHQDQTLHSVPLPMSTPPAPAEVMSVMLFLLHIKSLCFPGTHMQQIRDNMQYSLHVFQNSRSHMLQSFELFIANTLR